VSHQQVEASTWRDPEDIARGECGPGMDRLSHIGYQRAQWLPETADQSGVRRRGLQEGDRQRKGRGAGHPMRISPVHPSASPPPAPSCKRGGVVPPSTTGRGRTDSRCGNPAPNWEEQAWGHRRWELPPKGCQLSDFPERSVEGSRSKDA
jgi:hypothetical protein